MLGKWRYWPSPIYLESCPSHPLSQSLQDDAGSSFWSQDTPHPYLPLHVPAAFTCTPSQSTLSVRSPSSWLPAKGNIISLAFVWNLKTPTNWWFGNTMGLGLLAPKREPGSSRMMLPGFGGWALLCRGDFVGTRMGWNWGREPGQLWACWGNLDTLKGGSPERSQEAPRERIYTP